MVDIIEYLTQLRVFEDNLISRVAMIILLFSLAIMLVFINANYSALGVPLTTTLLSIVLLFVILLIFSTIAFILDWSLGDKLKATGQTIFLGFGSNLIITSIAIIFAIWLGWWIVASNLSILGASLPASIGIEESINLDYVYKTIFSPIIEELFFRGTLIPLFALGIGMFAATRKWKTSKAYSMLFILLAIILSSLIFGIMHVSAFQGSVDLILSTALWGMLNGLLMYSTKSIAPSIALHFANNNTIYWSSILERPEMAIIINLGLTFFIVIVVAYHYLKKWKLA